LVLQVQERALYFICLAVWTGRVAVMCSLTTKVFSSGERRNWLASGTITSFHHLLPEFTALENTMMPKLIRGDNRDAAEAEARQILGRVGLGHRLDHKVGEVSGGEQQRIAIARALIGKPELLLADEPTGNLDHRTGDVIFGMVRELHAERGLTSVIVTHNDRIAVQCDEIWEMDSGLFERTT
jgi:lipoprotein-releasing system ATP-binding protein